MSDFATTPRLGLKKPTVDADDDLWGDHLNQNMDILDTAPPAAHTHPISDVTGLQSALNTIQSDIDTHEARTDNPHAVTAAQVGALTQTQGDARYLRLAGGVLTGMLTLFADAASALQPVTLQQLNAKAGAYLPLAGGTLTGPLTLAGDGTLALHAVTLQQLNAKAGAYLPLAGGTLTGLLTLSGNATLPLHAVPLQQLATYAPLASPGFTGVPTAPTAAPGTNTTQIATTAFVLAIVSGGGSYLPLAGGVLTGSLQLPPGSAAAPSLLFDANGVTGIYGGASTVALTIQGTSRLTLLNTTLTINANVRTGVGSAAAPVYSFTADTGLGMYRNASGVLGFAVAGADALLLSATAATFTAAIVLPGNAATNLQAVPLQQVNSLIGSAAYLPLAGGTLTGNLTLSLAAGDVALTLNKPAGQTIRIFGQSAGQTRWVINMANATAETGGNAGSDWSLNRYTDAGALIDSAIAITRATGAVQMNAFLGIGMAMPANASAGGFVVANGPSIRKSQNILWNGYWSGGQLVAIEAGGGGLFWFDDTNKRFEFKYANNVAAGAALSWSTPIVTIDSGGSITAIGSVWAANKGGGFGLQDFGGGYWGLRFQNDGWRLQWGSAGSGLQYVNNSGTPLHTFKNDGGYTNTGSIIAGAGVSALGDATFGMAGDVNNRIFQFKTSWYLNFAMSTGDLSWIGSSGTVRFAYRSSTDNVMYNNFAPMQGVGAYINSSDERGKIDIGATSYGLAEILKINPIHFRRRSRVKVGAPPSTRVEIGFSAQDVQRHIPEAVLDSGLKPMKDAPDLPGCDAPTLLGIQAEAIVAAMVNAIKTLNARLAVLERGT